MLRERLGIQPNRSPARSATATATGESSPCVASPIQARIDGRRLSVQADIAGENDIHCVTHVVNGEVRVDDTYDAESVEAVPDYLTVYRSEQGFEFAQLIHDDYFEAIRLLWNTRKYVSCLKLVLSAIDTLGFVEYGPNGGNCFARWLDDYCDFGSLGLTSAELWELRNSLIHITNLDSRKVHSGTGHPALQIAEPERRWRG